MNPSHDPTTTRYAKARIDAREKRDGSTCPTSPVIAPPRINAAPPTIISMAAATSGRWGRDRLPLVQRTARPAERARHDHEHPGQIDPPDGGGATHERRGAGEAEHHAGGDRAWMAPMEDQPVEDHEPERKGREDEGRDPRRDPRLGPDDPAVAASDQEHADDPGGAPLQPARPVTDPVAAADRDGVQDRPRDQEAETCRSEGWQCLIGHPDREIGRAPDHVHAPEREPDRTGPMRECVSRELRAIRR